MLVKVKKYISTIGFKEQEVDIVFLNTNFIIKIESVTFFKKGDTGKKYDEIKGYEIFMTIGESFYIDEKDCNDIINKKDPMGISKR